MPGPELGDLVIEGASHARETCELDNDVMPDDSTSLSIRRVLTPSE